MGLTNPNWAEHSMTREHSLVWNKIWSLNVPSKVRTFLWRACSNYLPTRDNLHWRRVSVESHCKICHHSSETVSHILWECPLARNVWAIFKGQSSEMQQHSHGLFHPFSSAVTENGPARVGEVGSHGVGNLERKEQIILRTYSDSPKGDT